MGAKHIVEEEREGVGRATQRKLEDYERSRLQSDPSATKFDARKIAMEGATYITFQRLRSQRRQRRRSALLSSRQKQGRISAGV